MSNIEIRKAARKQAKLRVGLSGPSGSGKTYSALLLARGLTSSWDKILMIDTENGSGELYSDLGDYNIITLTAPFSPERYIEAIQAAEEAGVEVIVIDSVTHEWDGKGGILEINEAMAQAKFGGNTWAAWSKTTPRHQKFLQAILQSNTHVITTVRNKVATLQTDDKKIKKVGTKEIQREGYEYELTVNFNVDRDGHMAVASKDRTGLFSERDPFIIVQETGEELLTWNNEGVVDVNALKRQVMFQLEKRLEIALPGKEDLLEFIKSAIPKLTEVEYKEENLPEIVEKLGAIEDKKWASETAWGPKEEEKQEEVAEGPADAAEEASAQEEEDLAKSI